MVDSPTLHSLLTSYTLKLEKERLRERELNAEIQKIHAELTRKRTNCEKIQGNKRNLDALESKIAQKTLKVNYLILENQELRTEIDNKRIEILQIKKFVRKQREEIEEIAGKTEKERRKCGKLLLETRFFERKSHSISFDLQTSFSHRNSPLPRRKKSVFPFLSDTFPCLIPPKRLLSRLIAAYRSRITTQKLSLRSYFKHINRLKAGFNRVNEWNLSEFVSLFVTWNEEEMRLKAGLGDLETEIGDLEGLILEVKKKVSEVKMKGNDGNLREKIGIYPGLSRLMKANGDEEIGKIQEVREVVRVHCEELGKNGVLARLKGSSVMDKLGECVAPLVDVRNSVRRVGLGGDYEKHWMDDAIDKSDLQSIAALFRDLTFELDISFTHLIDFHYSQGTLSPSPPQSSSLFLTAPLPDLSSPSLSPTRHH